MRKPFFVGSVLLVATLVLVACGSGAKPEQSPAPQASSSAPAQQPAAPSSAAASPAAPAASPSPSQAAKPSASASTAPASSAASGPQLKDLLGKAKVAAFKATYKTATNIGGQAMSGEQIWTVKGPKFRMDSTISMGPAQVTSSIYVLEDAMYVCSAVTGQPACVKLAKEMMSQASGLENMAFDLNSEMEKSPDKFTTSYQGSEQIAGQTAHCYSIKRTAASTPGTPGPPDADVLACYGEQGAPLKTTMKSSAFSSEMIATSFSTAVSDNDFALPAPVVEMPSLPGQIPGQAPGGPPRR